MQTSFLMACVAGMKLILNIVMRLCSEIFVVISLSDNIRHD